MDVRRRPSLLLVGTLLVGTLAVGTLSTSCGSSSTTTPPPGGGDSDGSGLIVAVTAGQSLAVSLDDRGDAWAWGYNGSGQLGDGTKIDRTSPVAVRMPNGVSFLQVDAGATHVLALDASGRAWAWGENVSGQLGNGTTEDALQPTEVEMPSGTTFTHVSAGFLYSLALDQDGKAWAWGRNVLGVLGDGTTTDRVVPTAVALPGDVTLTTIAAGSAGSFGLDANGDGWAWGDNIGGALGDSTEIDRPAPTRMAMPAGTSFTAIAAGRVHALALDSDGRLWGWGINVFGEVGDGTSVERHRPVAVQVPPGARFVAVAAGSDSSLALDASGRAWGWGANYYGQIGDGSSDGRSTPTATDMPDGVTFVGVAAGEELSIAVDGDGGVWTWGYNAYGELGDGTAYDDGRPKPGPVAIP